jgi:excisionase family DNA binding protein
MATDTKRLVERARDARQRLVALGMAEEALIVDELIDSIVQRRGHVDGRGYYTTTEAARLIGVTAQTVKNWVARGLLDGYRLGGRIVIPFAALVDYEPVARAMRAVEPAPPVEQVVEDVRAGRRRPPWRQQNARDDTSDA